MMPYNSANSAFFLLATDRSTRSKSNRVFESIAAIQPQDLQVDLGRGFLGTLSDLGWIAFGWLMLLVIIIYPVLQLIGLLACSMALLLASGKPQAAPAPIRTERQVSCVSR